MGKYESVVRPHIRGRPQNVCQQFTSHIKYEMSLMHITMFKLFFTSRRNVMSSAPYEICYHKASSAVRLDGEERSARIKFQMGFCFESVGWEYLNIKRQSHSES